MHHPLSWVLDSSKSVSEVKSEKAGADGRNRSQQTLGIERGVAPIRTGGVTPGRAGLFVWADVVTVVAPHR